MEWSKLVSFYLPVGFLGHGFDFAQLNRTEGTAESPEER
jgi:hypothetical protein